jgi:hypothetical protein
VFLDEISRCRPATQTKLFSVVHEKRVQGMALPKLRYRWAAMNPPLTARSDLDADHPLDLEYRSFAESREGIRWPTLKLRRASN